MTSRNPFRNLILNIKPLREFLDKPGNTMEDTINMLKGDPSTEIPFIRKRVRKDHNWSAGKFGKFSFTANSIRNLRLDQEDRYTSLPCPDFTGDWSFFGVYDGHGGAIISEYLKRKLHVHILEQFEKLGDMGKALYQGFIACDEAIRTMKEDEFNEIRDDTMKEFTGSKYQPATSGRELPLCPDYYAEIKRQFLEYLEALQASLNRAPSASQGEGCPSEENDEPGVRRSKRLKKENTAGYGHHSYKIKEKLAKPVSNKKKEEDDEVPLVGLSMGSTATVVVFNKEILYVASVGDSGCLAAHKRRIYPLSYRHVPHDEEEKRRILASGHSVSYKRIDGELNISRAFGDFIFKNNKNLAQEQQAVIAEPLIISVPIKQIDFIVLGTDGIWNDKATISVGHFVIDSLFFPTEEIIAETIDLIILQGGLDNMSLIIIKNDEKCDDYPTAKSKTNKRLAKRFKISMEAMKTASEESKMKKQEDGNLKSNQTRKRKSETHSNKVKKFKK